VHALIIEDEVSTVDCIEQALRARGYASFDIAFSGAEARAAAHRRCPDLITADLKLVDGSGVEAVREICAHMAIPVVFITSHRPEIVGLLPGAFIVEKPFGEDSLGQALAQAVNSPFLSPTA
jgi:two-component system, response regulator PdtaR